MRSGSVKQLVSLLSAVLLFASVFTPQTYTYAADFAEKPVSSNSVNVSERYSSGKQLYAKVTKQFAEDAADTSFTLFRETVSAAQKNENLLISPDSVITVLSMLEAGAKGKTKDELNELLGGTDAGTFGKRLNGLHRSLSASKTIRYDTANSLWYRSGIFSIKKNYLKKIARVYGADIYKAPFDDGTAADMNNWAYNHTQGKISSIIDRLDPAARTVLMNAVYFKGAWEDPYSRTVKRSFTSSSGKKKKVPMLEGTENTYLEIAGGKGFVKKYSGGGTAFAALLPPKGMSARAFAKKLTGSAWIKGYRNRTVQGVKVRTRMPEFSYEFKTSLKRPLKKAGIHLAFTDQADFGKITKESISIDDILHKTYIKLDKDGTEAAAVTAAILKANSLPPRETKIRTVYLNRPFIYAIIDTGSGIPLFIGIVNKIK